MAKPKVLFVVGTRPDAIKSAPVVKEFMRYSDKVDTCLVATGQHREMLDQALATFDLKADHDLAIMQHGQTLAQVTYRILEQLDQVLVEEAPQVVLAQGDTTTTFVASLAAFYRQTSFAHIEAGLRTEGIDNPFPEEFNRRATALVSRLHFAPTQWAAENLLNEHYPAERVIVTGNTGIDAVHYVAEREPQSWYQESNERVVLLTTHRRENWGDPQKAICVAAMQLVEEFSDIRLVVPMHRNPRVRETLEDGLGGHARVDLIEPPEYAKFVKLMQRSSLILTDSGGIQEEAPAFGVPVLVLRKTTERPEGVKAGTAKLVGVNREVIYREAHALLSGAPQQDVVAKRVSPYGDGKASARIRYHVLKMLHLSTPEVDAWDS